MSTPLSREQFIARAVREARAGLSPEESRIYADTAALHVKDALQELCRSCEHDQKRRFLLTKDFVLNTKLDIGSVQRLIAFDVSPLVQLWREGIRYATAFVMEAPPVPPATFVPADGQLPLQWEASLELMQARNESVTGSFHLRGNVFFVKGVLNSTADFIGLNTIYEPDFSADYPLPIELTNQAVAYLAAMLRPMQPAALAKNAAANS